MDPLEHSRPVTFADATFRYKFKPTKICTALERFEKGEFLELCRVDGNFIVKHWIKIEQP